jgi:hypothetical protein
MQAGAARLALLICALSAACGSGLRGGDAQAPKREARQGVRRALVVGCTTYDHNRRRSLRGPTNDVNLLAGLLQESFGFANENVGKLTEGLGPRLRPIRSAIVREIKSLIGRAKSGDQVLLYFAGHGSQQPDQLHSAAGADEADGLDEVFLPADAGKWNGATQAIENAIVDDELRDWISQLLDRGAEVVVIMDACHSGSGIRTDVSDEVARQIPLAELAPADELARIAQVNVDRAASARDVDRALDPLNRDGWVAIYAAASDQTTPEIPLSTLQRMLAGSGWEEPSHRPARAKADVQGFANEETWHGLFTLTLCQALQRTPTPSCEELAQIVRGAYLAQGRFAPTPVVEGAAIQRPFLGARNQPRSFQLLIEGGVWRVTGGLLHGLTPGTIMSVHSIEPETHFALAGHVRIVRCGATDSIAAPHHQADGRRVRAAGSNLPNGALCRVAQIEFGDFRPSVGIDPALLAAGAAGAVARSLLSAAARDDEAAFRFEDDPRHAQWLLSPAVNSSGHWLLVPRAAAQMARRSTGSSAEAAGEPGAPQAVEMTARDLQELARELRAVARAQNLCALAARSMTAGTETDLGLAARLELRQAQPAGKPDPSVNAAPGQRPVVHAGDRLEFVVVNNEPRQSIDFVLLFIDSRFSMQAIHPRNPAERNRLEPGARFTRSARVNANTAGVERALLIAVAARGSEPFDFSFLTRPAAGNPRSAGQQVVQPALQPVELLLRAAAFAGATTREAAPHEELRPFHLELRDWMVKP